MEFLAYISTNDKNTFQKHEKSISNLKTWVEGLKISIEENKAKLAAMETTTTHLAESNMGSRQEFKKLVDFPKKEPPEGDKIKFSKVDEGNSSLQGLGSLIRKIISPQAN